MIETKYTTNNATLEVEPGYRVHCECGASSSWARSVKHAERAARSMGFEKVDGKWICEECATCPCTATSPATAT